MVVPVRRNSGCRIRFSITVCRTRSRKAIRAASKWWTTSPASQDTEGELLRANRGDDAEEGVSDRVKPSPSREAVEAISIHRSSPKLSCKGGRVIRRVTRCQR
jgi:hypothetical protein